MSLTLYGLKNCDTCKKALNALKQAGHGVDFVDIRAEADLERLLPDWLKTVGPDQLINRRSTTWRNLSEAERGRAPLKLLTANPTLIKRPVIVSAEKVSAGWTKDIAAKFS